MEPNKQIDYGTLEWFDCQKNFPPMNINLYVDSEHGFGIGRLGKRVKDGSTIWDVHLDSGEVYLVYAFYKVKRWAYMPMEKKMSELKVYHCNEWHNEYTEFYMKSDVDKVIADLEESHKMEVEQLLMEIAGLKDKLQNVSGLLKETREWLIESQRMHKRCADGAIKKIRHHKYKRCLDNAKICCEKKDNCYNRALRKYSKDEADYLVRKSEFWQDWEFRWLKIAEKFKEEA